MKEINANSNMFHVQGLPNIMKEDRWCGSERTEVTKFAEKGLNWEFFLGPRGSTWNSNSLAFPGGKLVTTLFDQACNGYCSDSFGLR